MAARRTKRIHRGGRPRQQRRDVDAGTPELIAKRAAVSRDPTLSTCPVDVMLSRRLIDSDIHLAAGYFAACRALVFGSPHPRALDLLRVSGSASIPNASEAEARYRRACAMLRQRGAAVLNAVEMLVVHERFPAWLAANEPCRARDLTMNGLTTLYDWYRGRNHRRAA